MMDVTRTRENFRGGKPPQPRLEAFIRARGLYQLDVARATGISRQGIHRWCIDADSPTLRNIRKLVRGIRKLTGDRRIKANDLFPLDDDE
jgi:transcriptional regulator with XRE-family HTH domain